MEKHTKQTMPVDALELEKTAKRCIHLIFSRCEEHVSGLCSIRQQRRHKALSAAALAATEAIRAFLAVEKIMK
jgi:hypothetical protein